jgi:DNA repair exonuclease SbcCD nuclease subunit
VGHVKGAQVKLQALIKSQAWVEEARKYAERQSKEVKKLLKADAGKVKIFLERERKELERFQKQIPAEVKKLRSFVTTQRKEFEKLLVNVRKFSANSSKKKKTKKATGTRKKAAPKKAAAAPMA